ncbi:MAG: hypothetical protein ACRDRO_04105 [Pseudonocardiaceae bacterium]
MNPRPLAPEQVRLVYPDSTEIPLQCRYMGQDQAGLHHWVVILPGATPMAGARLLVGMLPARTAVDVGTLG